MPADEAATARDEMFFHRCVIIGTEKGYFQSA